MGKYKPYKGPRRNQRAVAPNAVGCVIVVVLGLVFVFLFMFYILRAGF